MPRILLVEPGAGAPDVLPIEGWHALTSVPAFAAPGDPLATRLREQGYDVTDLPEAAAEAPPPAPGPVKGRNLLVQHAHGATSPGARALADRLASLALEREAIAYVVSDPSIVRATFERALDGDVEVEVVVGRLPRGHLLLEVVRVMARLRGPGGCPWDAEQTHQTLAKHLLDETYELLDAIEGGTPADIAEELGDLLLQVVFHAQMGADAGTFDVDDVAHGLAAKLVRRHPHVFAGVEVSGADEVVANWDEIKRHEKGEGGPFEGVPDALPALALAQKLLRRAGDEVDASAARERAAAALAGAAGDDAMGELLFATVELARALDVDAETALRRAARRFRDERGGG